MLSTGLDLFGTWVEESLLYLIGIICLVIIIIITIIILCRILLNFLSFHNELICMRYISLKVPFNYTISKEKDFKKNRNKSVNFLESNQELYLEMQCSCHTFPTPGKQ